MDTARKQSAPAMDKNPLAADMNWKPIVLSRHNEDDDSLPETRYMHVECQIVPPSRGPKPQT
jgi:hypothetical protein